MIFSDINMLASALKTSLTPGGLVIFQCPPNMIGRMDEAMKQIIPVLKAKDIGVLLFSDEISVVMVPEARRAIGLAYDGGAKGSGI